MLCSSSVHCTMFIEYVVVLSLSGIGKRAVGPLDPGGRSCINPRSNSPVLLTLSLRF